MVRISWALLAGLCILVAGTGKAVETEAAKSKNNTQDASLAGNWKLSIFMNGANPSALWLINLKQVDGKWKGEVLDRANDRLPQPLIGSIRVVDGLLNIALTAPRLDNLTFEGVIPKGQIDKLTGSLDLGSRLVAAELVRTSLKNLSPYEVAQDTLKRGATAPEVLDAVSTLLEEAGKKNVTVEEVRSWADKAVKSAESFGPRMKRDTILTVARKLAEQKKFAEVAVAYARRAERALGDKDSTRMQVTVLNALAKALENAGKDQEAKEIKTRIDKLAEIKIAKFGGRKAKSERAVMVELFTGTQCPPCVAADKAFDALSKTYATGEVILLQYHEHIPGPDPLTNPDTEARMRYYRDLVEGTPTMLFNGKPGALGGGGLFEAPTKYKEYRDIIEPILEEGASVKLRANAVRKGNKVEITAEVNDLAKPGAKVHLRLALLEDKVEYQGPNKVAEHRGVVRALPGGSAGWILKEKNFKQSVTVDVDEVRNKLQKYLDDFAKDNMAFPPGAKPYPLNMKNLRVVAFVQDDETFEVLQAVQVAVPAAQ